MESQHERSSGSAYKPGSLGHPHHIHAPRIKLLSDLHRPLEEHWQGKIGGKKGGKGLDAIGSDYTYKHHITRLEEIYKTQTLDATLGFGEEPVIGPTNISPQAQLYGTHGLLSPHVQQGYHEWKDKRESGWDPYIKVEQRPLYLDKVSALSEKRIPPPPKCVQKSPKESNPNPASRPSSAAAHASSAARSKNAVGQSSQHPNISHTVGQPNSSHNHSQRTTSSSATRAAAGASALSHSQHNNNYPQQPQTHHRTHGHRCPDPHIPSEALIVQGMYRLTPQQASIYSAFVDLLMEFDAYDQSHIVEDALVDAKAVTMLDSFGGAGHRQN